MGASHAVVVINATNGQPLMVVVPDTDEQLKDPAFNPSGSVQIKIPMQDYKISSREQLKSIVDVAIAQLGIVVPDSPIDGQQLESPPVALPIGSEL